MYFKQNKIGNLATFGAKASIQIKHIEKSRCIFEIYSSKKVLHHLYFIHVFPKILQISRKITKVYW